MGWRRPRPASGYHLRLRGINPIESMIGRGRDVARNVKRYRAGKMALRCTITSMAEAQKSFRRVQGTATPRCSERASTATLKPPDVDKNRRAP